MRILNFWQKIRFLLLSRFITSLSYIILFLLIISSINLCIFIEKTTPHLLMSSFYFWQLQQVNRDYSVGNGKDSKNQQIIKEKKVHFWFQFYVFLSDFTRFCTFLGLFIICLSKLTFPSFKIFQLLFHNFMEVSQM